MAGGGSEVEKVSRDIRALRIQGAREIAKSAVRALSSQAANSRARNTNEFLAELIEAVGVLSSARPTEPMLRNALKRMLDETAKAVKSRKIKNAKEGGAVVVALQKKLLAYFDESESVIADYGAKIIEKGSTILTHCHSHTVVGALVRAHELGKNIEVICTETRPLFQGRRTARELADRGVPVTLIVDSAAASFMKDVDVVLVGADAVSATGDLVNKIGTAGIAALAYANNIPFYSAAEIYKFDPITLWGNREKIEERGAREIVDAKSARGIKVRNPAFDVTPAKFVGAYITEKGVVPPGDLLSVAWRELNLGAK
ncbi:MAG: S-methyl-5-thioribose-1-phosphate isomerase [Candidatus Micrarchaeota archaeon]